MVASEVNETARLTNLPKNKSLTLRVDFKTEDTNLSPVMDLQNSTFILGRNKVNNPVDDYVKDQEQTQLIKIHTQLSLLLRMVSLEQPATSLKVLIAANRQPDADFRVLYLG